MGRINAGRMAALHCCVTRVGVLEILAGMTGTAAKLGKYGYSGV
jgi:hypothetical protein